MSTIRINHLLCHKDALCIRECPALLLTLDENRYPQMIPGGENLCINCGHCVSVCPYGALSHKLMIPKACLEKKDNMLLSENTLEYFFRSRRSIRQYKNLNVNKKTIEKLLHVAKYAPSAKNLRPTNWIILNTGKKVNRAATLVANWMKSQAKKHEMQEQFSSIIDAWNQGKDRILRNAPALLIGHANNSYKYAMSDIATAIAYVELAAQTYKLGSCWAGYFTTACQTSDELKKYIQLPKNNSVHGSVMVGFPDVEYHRMPNRKNYDLTWI